MTSCYELFESLLYLELIIDAHPHESAISLCLGYRINRKWWEAEVFTLLCYSTALIDSDIARQCISSTFVLDP
jgi:hypothetical protein